MEVVTYFEDPIPVRNKCRVTKWRVVNRDGSKSLQFWCEVKHYRPKFEKVSRCFGLWETDKMVGFEEYPVGTWVDEDYVHIEVIYDEVECC